MEYKRHTSSCQKEKNINISKKKRRGWYSTTSVNPSEGYGARKTYFNIFFSSFTSNSRGVCILINKWLPFTLESCTKDDAGRYAVIKGCLFGENISILNVYAPPGHPLDLITKAFLELVELDCTQSLADGDFNCILDPHIDKSLAEGTNPTKWALATADVCDELGYLDV